MKSNENRARRSISAALILLLGVAACATEEERETVRETQRMETADEPIVTEEATFGAGCFWCVEAVFERLDGVTDVSSGYTGGKSENPTYQEVCSGTSDHVEVCRIVYDPAKVSFVDLLEVFWKTHDPTTPNRQGNDVGTQYRSVVFYHDEGQREQAETYRTRLDESGAFDAPIVTTIEPLGRYYPAENYHQDYYRRNPNQGYCQMVVRPKVAKLEKAFADRVKK